MLVDLRNEKNYLMENIKSYLHETIGIPTRVDGFRYLCLAVYYCIKNKDCDIEIDDVYTYISEETGISITEIKKEIFNILTHCKLNVYLPQNGRKEVYLISYATQHLIMQLELY